MRSVNELGLRAPTSSQRSLVGAEDKPSLSDYVDVLAAHRSSEWAWRHYKDVLTDLLRIRDARCMLEIGAGRFPLFDRAEIACLDVDYIANDVDPSELARTPDEVGKACFDISTTNTNEVDALCDTVDLTFSKMVFEHLPDAQQAYRNIYKILSPGGICLNFHPVLFSLPFLINYLIPTATAEQLLKKFSPKRNSNEHPKFPAKYDRCWVSKSMRDNLRSIGFREVWQLPFWFHEYFVKFPGLQQFDLVINKIAERANWTTLASYCYTIAVK
jgi:SAM-dependent methyltransferase